MASLVLYGSSVADATLTTAGDCSTTTGGTETSKTTVATGSNQYAEMWSQGSAGVATAASIPATPTGHGWVYQPGAGTFALGNWSASVTFQAGGTPVQLTIRFFKYSGGSYTSIGTIAVSLTGTLSNTKTTKSFAATSMPATTFAGGDFVYIDLWYFDNSSNAGGDNPIIYESTSATAGVANDMQITTANFTPAVALGVTIPGAGTLAGTTTRVTALASTLAGAGTLSGTTQLATALSTTLAGAGTLVGTLSGAALTGTMAGAGTLSGTYQLSSALADTCAGAGQLSGSLSAAFSLAGSSLAGGATLLGTVSLGAALLDTVAGTSTLSGTPAYATQLARSLAGAGQLSGALSASNVYFANPGDNLQTKAQALIAGDTLILNDGTYSTSPGLNFSAIHGTASAPITIKAANDGMALLDGGGTFVPLFMTNCSYVTIQGLRVQNSSGNVVYLFAGSGSGNGPLDHITLQRITAHGSGGQNTHVFAANQDASFGPPSTCTNILMEDCAAWGPGRYLFSTYCADSVTFRRCYGYWTTISDTLLEPRAPFNIYGTVHVIIENCIGLHAMPYQTEANNNYFAACWHTSLGPNYIATDSQILGCVFYGNYDGYWLNDDVTGPVTFKDCYFETPQPANTSFTTRPFGEGWRSNNPVAGTQTYSLTNCTFRNSVLGLNRSGNTGTMTLSNSAFVGNTTAIANDSGHDHCDWFGNTSNGTTPGGGDLTVDPDWAIATYGRGGALFIPAASPLKGAGASGADIGANILYQYVNGVLTTTPLWPWPMEARILAELGQSPTYASNGGPWTTLAGVYSIPGTSTAYIPRALSALLVLTVTALTDTLSGVSTLGGTLSLSTALTATLSGTSQLSGPLAATLPLSGTNLVGESTLAGTLSLTRYVVSTLAGTGTLTGSGQLTTALAGTMTGAGQFSGALTTIAGAALVVTIAGVGTSVGTVQLATSLGTMLAGGATLTGTLAAALPLASMTCAGTGTLAGTPGLTTALFTTYAGVGTLSGPLSANIQLASITIAGSGTLAGTVALGTALANTLSGTGQLSGAISASFTVARTMAGVGTLVGTAGLGTALANTLSGTGALTGTAPTLKTSLTSTCAGVGTLTGAISGGGALATTVAGTSSLSSTLSLSTALAGSLAGAGTLAAPLSVRMALSGILSGTGSSAGTLSLLAAYQATLAGTSQLSGTSVLTTYLMVALPGSSGLSGTSTRVTLLGVVYLGSGQFSPSLVIGGALTSCLFTGIGQLAGALTFPGPSATATWKTRDMKATWKTRDMKATWVARDDKATWKTRR